jgi:hypothetical protein
MLEIIPSLLRSWEEEDKTIPHARTRRRRRPGRAVAVAVASRGVSGIGKVLPYTNYGNLLPFWCVRSHKCWSTSTLAPTSLPLLSLRLPKKSYIMPRMNWLARTGLCESRSLQNVRRSRIYLLRWRPVITFLGSVFDTSTRYCSVVFLYYSFSVVLLFTRYCSGREWGSALQPFCTAYGILFSICRC